MYKRVKEDIKEKNKVVIFMLINYNYYVVNII